MNSYYSLYEIKHFICCFWLEYCFLCFPCYSSTLSNSFLGIIATTHISKWEKDNQRNDNTHVNATVTITILWLFIIIIIIYRTYRYRNDNTHDIVTITFLYCWVYFKYSISLFFDVIDSEYVICTILAIRLVMALRLM